MAPARAHHALVRNQLNSLLGVSLCPWRKWQASEQVVQKFMSIYADIRKKINELIKGTLHCFYKYRLKCSKCAN